MEFKDYYKTLGVERGADEAAIKRAYRRLARKYHPDVSKEANAEERFKAVSEAYEVLKDADKRATYDELASSFRRGERFTPPPGWRAGQGAGRQRRDFDFSDFFESLFGGGRGFSDVRFEDMPGGDEQHIVEVELEEAYHGVERALRIEAASAGLGARAGSRPRTVKVKVPARITDGQRIRLAGQGRAGPGGRRGDLFLQVRIRPHRYFQVDGRDVSLTLPVTPWEAALGASIKVPTLGGAVELRIPRGTQSGRRLRLKGRGLGHAPSGDQYVRIEVHAPTARTADDERLLRRMAEQMAFDPRAERFG